MQPLPISDTPAYIGHAVPPLRGSQGVSGETRQAK